MPITENKIKDMAHDKGKPKRRKLMADNETIYADSKDYYADGSAVIRNTQTASDLKNEKKE